MNKFATFVVTLVCLAAAFLLIRTGPLGDGTYARLKQEERSVATTASPGASAGSNSFYLGGTDDAYDAEPVSEQITYIFHSTGQYTIRIAAGRATRVAFTAPSSGNYSFRTLNAGDTVGTLYTSEYGEAAARIDDNGSDQNFLINYALYSGQTVYLDVEYFNSSYDGTVTLMISQESQSRDLSAMPTCSLSIGSLGYNNVHIRSGHVARVRFTAPSAGTYVFTTNEARDTIGLIYAGEDSNEIITQNDDYNGDQCFRIERTMRANETICLGVLFYSSNESGYIQVRIYKQGSSGGSASGGSTTTNRSSSGRPANWPVGETITVYVSSGNTRTGPGTGYSWSGYVNRGYTFTVVERRLGDTGKDWYKIWHEGQYQWISSGIVEIDGYRNGTINGEPFLEE